MKLRPTLSSLSMKTGQGFVPGVPEQDWWTGKQRPTKVEHGCNPPANARDGWTCGCGRVWSRWAFGGSMF